MHKYSCTLLVLLCIISYNFFLFFFFQAEDGIRDLIVTGVQTCALPISGLNCAAAAQFKPGNVNTGCASGNNVVDRATSEDTGLTSVSGFSVTIAKQSGSSTIPYTGCGTTVGTTVAAGDTVVVTTKANFGVITPLIGSLVGNNIVVTRTISVVVQG